MASRRVSRLCRIINVQIGSGCGHGGDIRHSPKLGIVAEFMEEPSSALRPFPTAVDSDSAVNELVRHGAVAAVEFPAVSYGLEFFEHGAVRPAAGASETKDRQGLHLRGGMLAAARSAFAELEPPSPPNSSDETPNALWR